MKEFSRDALDPDRQPVARARLDDAGDIETEAPKHAGMPAKTLTIQPNLAGVIDAVEDQFEAPARQMIRQVKVASIPPVFARRLRQPWIARAVPERLQPLRRFQVGLDIARHGRWNPAVGVHVGRVKARLVGSGAFFRLDAPVRAA